MNKETAQATHYELLHVHPAAPLDLITAAYWRLADRVQSARSSDNGAATTLHRLTRAYQTLADPSSRARYDSALGLKPPRLVPDLPANPQRPSLVRRLLFGQRSAAFPRASSRLDYYEILRVDPRAQPAILSAAQAVMHDYYLRLVRLGDAPTPLLDILDEAYAVTSDPARRQQYDADRARARPHREEQRQPAAAVHAEVLQPTTRREDLAAQAGVPHPAEDQDEVAPSAGRPEPRLGPAASKATKAVGGALVSLAERAAPHVCRWSAALWRRLVALSWTAAENGRELGARGGRLAVALANEAAEGLASAIADRRVRWRRERVVESDEEELLIKRVLLASVPADDPAGLAGAVARLIGTAPPGGTQVFELSGRSLTLGSDESADIHLPGTAPRQGRLWCRDGHFMIYDLADDPVTLVNGRPAVWAVLEDGDRLSVGPHEFRFDRGGIGQGPTRSD